MSDLLVATGHGSPGWFHDEHGLGAAFDRRGVRARPMHWKDIEPDGTPILVRTVWDYSQSREAFNDWLGAIEETSTPCINSVERISWNMDKRYLLEMKTAGHRVVESVVLEDYNEDAARDVMERHGWVDGIVKPVVGCGAEGLVRLGKTTRTYDLSGNTWAPDASPTPVGACLVQPFMPEIHNGEWSLMFFGGKYQFAIRKKPKSGDIRVQEEHGGRTVVDTPSEALIDDATAMVKTAGVTVARVDGLEVNGRFTLMELECIEPELYFRYAPGHESGFVDAVVQQLAHAMS